MHIINIEEDRIGLRFGVTQENRLVLLAVTEGKNDRHVDVYKRQADGRPAQLPLRWFTKGKKRAASSIRIRWSISMRLPA